MTPDELEERVKRFALEVCVVVDALPRTTSGRVMGDQLLRSATSTAANYRAARRARSRREFVSKLCIVVEEVDEAEFWLEMLGRTKLGDLDQTRTLYKEARELTRIFSTQRRTAQHGKEDKEAN